MQYSVSQFCHGYCSRQHLRCAHKSSMLTNRAEALADILQNQLYALTFMGYTFQVKELTKSESELFQLCVLTFLSVLSLHLACLHAPCCSQMSWLQEERYKKKRKKHLR